jgi:endonuclease-3 related protein
LSLGKKQKLNEVYNLLSAHFGPRNWWPAESDLEVIVGAILTQNVSWKNTATAIGNLKEKGLLSIEGIKRVPLEELALIIKSTRYHTMKAKKLKAFVAFLEEKHLGSLEKLFAQPLEQLRRELLSVYGIGEETADSIILYAGRKPIFVVDAYTKRIFQRLGVFPEKITYKEMQECFHGNLPREVQLYNEYHALIVGLGNKYCSNQKPRCTECPLREACQHS